MNWFRQNRWLGTFLIAFGICTLVAVFFLFSAKSGFVEAATRFKDATTERNRLERLDPFPSDANYQKMKIHLENYSAALDKMKQSLKPRMLPVVPMAPNEFQTRLRQATMTTQERARANRVKLPATFYLGFNEFVGALPNTAAAPFLGEELSQIELLMNILIDARADSVKELVRKTPPPETAAATTPPAGPASGPSKTPAPGAFKMIERNIVDLTFVASPSVARKILNQIASSEQQFYIIRTLQVHNEQDKGPPRASTEPGGSAATAAPAAGSAIKFIVGNEHIEIAARIEMVRFTF
jgi:hypothetical protein